MAASAEQRERKRLYNAAWRAANAERMAALRLAWDTRNADRKRAVAAIWRQSHSNYKREWRAKNPDLEMAQRARGRLKKNARTAAYAKERPDLRAVNEQRRRSRKMESGGRGVTLEQWKQAQADFGNACAYCARPKALVMDHLDPLSKGGPHDIGNIVPACRRCNARKSWKPLVLWLATTFGRVRQ